MIGETIGNFVAVSRLGRGGMGEVFLAEHRELGTRVAVKVLDQGISEDHDHVQRFFNEARIVGKIKHAGTIQIFDSGFVKGHAFLVMELLEGESLAARIKRVGAQPIARVLDIARQIANVLAAHKVGVVHRDLKPDNIFLVHDDERASGERVKVLDFGIAKLSGTLAASSPKTLGLMGTPAYMAPEQWQDTASVAWQADAYSLGCVIYELICTRPPFVAPTIPEAYTKHAFEAPPSARATAPAVPIALDALIVRLLAKDPAARGESMADIARELEVIARGVPDVEPFADPLAGPSDPPPVAMSATTLGATASQIGALGPATTPPPKSSRAIAAIAAIGVAAVIAGVAVLIANRGDTAPSVAPHVALPDAALPDAAMPDAAIPDARSDAPPPLPDARLAPSTIKHTVPVPVTPDAAAPVQPTPDPDDLGGRR